MISRCAGPPGRPGPRANGAKEARCGTCPGSSAEPVPSPGGLVIRDGDPTLLYGLMSILKWGLGKKMTSIWMDSKKTYQPIFV